MQDSDLQDITVKGKGFASSECRKKFDSDTRAKKLWEALKDFEEEHTRYKAKTVNFTPKFFVGMEGICSSVASCAILAKKEFCKKTEKIHREACNEYALVANAYKAIFSHKRNALLKRIRNINEQLKVISCEVKEVLMSVSQYDSHFFNASKEIKKYMSLHVITDTPISIQQRNMYLNEWRKSKSFVMVSLRSVGIMIWRHVWYSWTVFLRQ